MYELVADSVALEFFAINPTSGVVRLIKPLTDDSFNALTYRVCVVVVVFINYNCIIQVLLVLIW